MKKGLSVHPEMVSWFFLLPIQTENRTQTNHAAGYATCSL